MTNQLDFKMYGTEIIIMSGNNVVATNESALEMWKDHIIGLTGEFYNPAMVEDWKKDLQQIDPNFKKQQKESVNTKMFKHRYGR